MPRWPKPLSYPAIPAKMDQLHKMHGQIMEFDAWAQGNKSKDYCELVHGFLIRFERFMLSSGLNLSLESVTQEHIALFEQDLNKNSGLKLSYINSAWVTLRGLYAYHLTVKKMACPDPTLALKGDYSFPREVRSLPNKMVPKFFASLPTQTLQDRKIKMLFVFLYAGCARFSEVANLRLKNLRLRQGKQNIRVETSGKNRKQRVFYFPAWLRRQLKRYMAECSVRKGNDLLFESCVKPGRPIDISTVCRLLAKVLKKCGLDREKYGTHIWRHTGVQQLIENGMDPFLLSHYVSHSTTQTLSVYSRPPWEKITAKVCRIMDRFKLRGVQGRMDRYVARKA